MSDSPLKLINFSDPWPSQMPWWDASAITQNYSQFPSGPTKVLKLFSQSICQSMADVFHLQMANSFSRLFWLFRHGIAPPQNTKVTAAADLTIHLAAQVDKKREKLLLLCWLSNFPPISQRWSENRARAVVSKCHSPFGLNASCSLWRTFCSLLAHKIVCWIESLWGVCSPNEWWQWQSEQTNVYDPRITIGGA